LPGPRGALLFAPSMGRGETTSFSSEQPFSLQQLSWLRSSSIDSPFEFAI
jgi:hypothetical protein